MLDNNFVRNWLLCFQFQQESQRIVEKLSKRTAIQSKGNEEKRKRRREKLKEEKINIFHVVLLYNLSIYI